MGFPRASRGSSEAADLRPPKRSGQPAGGWAVAEHFCSDYGYGGDNVGHDGQAEPHHEAGAGH